MPIDIDGLVGDLGIAGEFAMESDRKQPIEFILDSQSDDIVLVRAGNPLEAQPFLVTGRGTATVYWELPSATAVIAEKTVILQGRTTADIKRKDRFNLRGTVYEVQYVDKSFTDRVEAYAEAQQ